MTILAVVLLVSSIGSLGSTAFVFANPRMREVLASVNEGGLIPLPIELQLAVGVLQACALIACAVALLRGHAWGRSLYVALTAVGYALAPRSAVLLPGLLLLGVTLFFLYRPAASAYLSAGGPASRAREHEAY